MKRDGLVQRRRRDSPMAPSQDPQSLTLMEEMLLLGLKDKEGHVSFWNDSISSGLRGCVLVELAFRQRIDLEGNGLRNRSLLSRNVVLKSYVPTGDVLLDEALRHLKELNKDNVFENVAGWIEYLNGGSWHPWKARYKLKDVRNRLAKNLVEKGVLSAEKRNYYLFEHTIYPLTASGVKERLTKEIQDGLLKNWVNDLYRIDERILTLVLMAQSCDVLENALASLGNVTSPAVFGLCLAGAIFVLCVAAVTCYCYRLRRSQNAKRHGPDQPLAFHAHRRPTAVKSPAGGNTTHYLKKSPSPTNPSRTPPSMSGANTPSPTGNGGGPMETSTNGNERIEPPAVRDVYTTESESHTPSKEEIETNEKNLQNNASYLGQLVFKLRYKHDKNALIVSVVRCRDLPAKDPNLGSSDPYVKLQLLPDKQHKVKTRVLRKTRNPVYDEDFTFYGINFNQLPSITLHFVVLSFDRYSRDDIIGEVFCALNTVDINQAENQQIALCREIQPRSLKIRSQGRGELLVSLCWQPAANRLTVVVLKARNLPKMDVTGLADPYVKMYLLYNGQRIAKKKTHVKKRTLSPVFNESFVFDIPAGGEGLENVNLEFLLLDWDRVTKNEVIGRLELGGPKCTGSALHHWNEVCNSPRRQIADWHKLRE